MKKPTISTAAGIAAIVIAIGITASGFARADETAPPTPTETASPTDTPTPTETPTDTPTPTPTPTDSSSPEPSEEPIPAPSPIEMPPPAVPGSGRLPIATSVKGAVTVALSTYCTSPSRTATNTDSWTVADPNEVNITGSWEVWATSTRGQLVVLVTPQTSQVIVSADSDTTRLAFATWGCPTVMAVGRM